MKTGYIRALFFAYALTLCWEAWWPLNFHFGGGPVGRVEWLPFGGLDGFHGFDLETYARKLAAFIPAGTILAAGWSLGLKGRKILAPTVVAGAGLSLLIQLGRCFLPGHYVSSGDVLVNAMGALIGASPAAFGHLSRRTLKALTASCAGCFLLAATWPWHFSLRAASLDALRERVEWSPFDRVFSLAMVKERALNGLMTTPLGLLCGAYVLRGGSGRSALKAAALLGLCCSAAVEGLQCFLHNRTPSLPDIALNTLGSFAGGAAAVWLERLRLHESGPRVEPRGPVS
jgi:VanZ family protein